MKHNTLSLVDTSSYWFSANIWPIKFKQRPNCSSNEGWFACIRRDDCVSISQSWSGSSACPICIRNGMAAASEMSVAALAVNSLVYCIVLYCIVLCCVVLCCVVLCCAVLCCVVLCCVVLCCVVLCCVVLCFIVLYCILLQLGLLDQRQQLCVIYKRITHCFVL